MLQEDAIKSANSVTIWFRGFGIILIILGVIALVLPVISSFLVEQFLGALLFVGGVLQALAAITGRKHHAFGFKLLWAASFIVTGLWLISQPIEGIASLALIVGILFIFEGLIKLSYVWRIRHWPHTGLRWIAALLSLLIGLALILGWPEHSSQVLGLLVGINLLSGGVMALSIATTSNDLSKTDQAQ